MSDIAIHLSGRLLLHRNKEGKLLGISLTKKVLEDNYLICRHPSTTEQSKCSLPECVIESESVEMRYIILATMEGTIRYLDLITIDETALSKLIPKSDPRSSNAPCSSFDPISSQYIGTHACCYCTLMESCYESYPNRHMY